MSQDGSATQSRKNPSSLIYIQVLVNNINTRAMIDTGSTISAIDAAYLKKLKVNERVHPTAITCRTANNNHMHVNGVITLPITINELDLTVQIFIVDGLCADLLLGGDFCNLYNVNINYGQRYLSIGSDHQRTTISFSQHLNEQQMFNLKTIEEVTIPPLSAKIIQATTTAPSMSAIFTPSSGTLNKQHVLAPHALLSIDNNHCTRLTLLNPTTSMQRIPKGTT